ncbi:MAG: tRNA dihydrouridine(20/20a) synthase DusA [Deltaproteobacteria bacterium]|nr:tRNA dihydrouridine(20/20a) synthase DusA [Deltaproteobacteria bacterium]
MRLVPHTLSIAPMMDVTDRHFRFFLRLITKHTLLYTPMIHAKAILLGDRQRLLDFNPMEHPIAIQLGGGNPAELAQAAKICEEFGYDEVNLNVGCPSSRVQDGNFGACLMATPELVAEAISQMKAAVKIPVTVKHRVGIDDRDQYEDMLDFVDTVAKANCDRFIVHARKAWLNGLNPKQNRSVPPLCYDKVYRLKRERPELTIVINGGIRTLDETRTHLDQVDGVMIGRAAQETPLIFVEADGKIFGTNTRQPSIFEAMGEYIEKEKLAGIHPRDITRHLAGLSHGMPGGKTWRAMAMEGHPDLFKQPILAKLAVERRATNI